MTRALIVTNILSPYRIPLFNAMAARPDLQIKVAFLAENEANRDWAVSGSDVRFDHCVLPGFHWFLARRERHIHLNWGLGRVVREFRPDVLATAGYDQVGYWTTLFHAKARRKRFVLCYESWVLSAEHTTGVIAAAKRWFVRQADAYVTFGTKARECLEGLGAPRARIAAGINTVDMDWYREQQGAERTREWVAKRRSEYPPLMLLYVGQLIERKNVKQVLDALVALGDSDIGLFVVGSGPQEAELRALCRKERLETVFFEGFRQQPDLPPYYAMADALVLPSVTEVWGLVVNEALATGLYVLCSDRAAVAHDLVRDGWNGRMFDPYDVEQLAGLLRETKGRIAEIRARREAIGAAACREFGIERSADAFVAGIRAAAAT